MTKKSREQSAGQPSRRSFAALLAPGIWSAAAATVTAEAGAQTSAGLPEAHIEKALTQVRGYELAAEVHPVFQFKA